MLYEEFTKLTGFYPTQEMYEEIEDEYYAFDGDKAAFCKAYVENVGGMAERITKRAHEEIERKRNAADDMIADLRDEVCDLKKRLEREEEWRPYTDSKNVPQEEYADLAAGCGTRMMTAKEAKDLLYDWFGFDRDRVTLYETLDKYEVNRHGVLRKVGEIIRLPLYNATDWNYIRFDCGRMAYELINGDLRLFCR